MNYLYRKIKKAIRMLRKEGLVNTWKWCKYLLRFWFRQQWFTLTYPYYQFIKKPDFFQWQGKKYQLFWHKYNATWTNERAIEIPIILETIRNSKAKNILEVGNVLSNYIQTQHDILDKYDRSAGVINEDIATFKPLKKYDLIVSISTLEHIGFDESPKEPEKILVALENLKNHCLAANGRIVITFPIGYNPHLDKFLKENRLNMFKLTFLKKLPTKNWQEVNWEKAKDASYGKPLSGVNVLVVAIYQ